MKKNFILLLAILLSTITFLVISCRHEIPITCEEVHFKITASQTDAILNSHTGSVKVKATGGSGFSYNINGGPLQDSGYFQGLAPFREDTIIGHNSLGCTDTLIITIGSFNPCQGVAINVTATKVDAAQNQSTGSITVTATGGTGFTYSLNGGAFQTSPTFSALPSGVYSVAAKSSSGCIGTVPVTIGTINPCAGVAIVVSTTVVNPVLNQSNGAITATATGSTGITYSLNGGTYQASGAFTGLAAGTYSVTAKNANGCTGSKQVSLIGTNPCTGITVVVTTTQVNPFSGQSNGSINASATGGSGFTYSLNNGIFQASGTFSNLPTGNYTVTAKNAAGCIGTKTVALGSTNPCAGVTITVSTTQVNPPAGQSIGSITATATGGTGLTYSINGTTFQASGTFSNLAAGTYTVTAKTSAGCLGTRQVTLTATDPCAGITIAVSATQVNPTAGLSNGSITASATGGTGFTYSLNNGTFQPGAAFLNLGAGTYTVTAKNSNGCTGTKQVTLTAVSACTGITITITPTVMNTVPCSTPANNGSITIAASGSTGFTYNNNGGAYQAGNIFSGLNAGNFLIGVKDANGCTKTQTVTVGITPKGPKFSAVRSIISARCGSCHLNGNSTAGYNFDSDCNVLTYWSQINKACVTYQMIQMPPTQQLPATEKASITSWINAGHKYTD